MHTLRIIAIASIFFSVAISSAVAEIIKVPKVTILCKAPVGIKNLFFNGGEEARLIASIIRTQAFQLPDVETPISHIFISDALKTLSLFEGVSRTVQLMSFEDLPASIKQQLIQALSAITTVDERIWKEIEVNRSPRLGIEEDAVQVVYDSHALIAELSNLSLDLPDRVEIAATASRKLYWIFLKLFNWKVSNAPLPKTPFSWTFMDDRDIFLIAEQTIETLKRFAAEDDVRLLAHAEQIQYPETLEFQISSDVAAQARNIEKSKALSEDLLHTLSQAESMLERLRAVRFKSN